VVRIGILIIDDDEVSQSALRQVLDSEGWHVRVVPVLRDALPRIVERGVVAVIANVSMTGLSGPVFLTLKELHWLRPLKKVWFAARVLFLVSDHTSSEARALLERERLPYVFKPFQFHDLLEKVSDLLMETDALTKPIRRVRHDGERCRTEARGEPRGHESAVRQGRRDTGMFANRAEYVMTEEEIAEIREVRKRRAEEKAEEAASGPVIPLYRRFVNFFFSLTSSLFGRQIRTGAVVLNGGKQFRNWSLPAPDDADPARGRPGAT